MIDVRIRVGIGHALRNGSQAGTLLIDFVRQVLKMAYGSSQLHFRPLLLSLA